MSHRLPEKETVADLSVEAVSDFLMAHPDFFLAAQDLLETLRLPQGSGGVISLATRQVELLRARNERLVEQMTHLVDIARENDTLNQRLHQLTLTLLDARCLEDILASLDWGLHHLFAADFAGVRLLEPVLDSPVAQLFVPRDHPLRPWALAEIDSGQVRCGLSDSMVSSFLFGADSDQIGSYVVLRLHHAGLRGLLAIGSRDPQRFSADMGSVFLSQLSEVLAARMAPLIESER